MIRRQPVNFLQVAVFFFTAIFVGAFISIRYIDPSTTLIDRNSSRRSLPNLRKSLNSQAVDIPLNCSRNFTTACYPSETPFQGTNSPSTACPDYFRWIYEDLSPWRETGITRQMVENSRRTANFRLLILNGKAYVKTYRKSFQSRDTFTLWGILQLLRKYPKKIPNLDLMFDCVDWPVIKKVEFPGPNYPAPPPLFRYCRDNSSYDIVFPDWSFWGWPEINIKPWEPLLKEIENGNNRRRWPEREPYAYWKGNPSVAATRMDLLKCNVSDKMDWNARVYAQDWLKEQKEGYNESDLASQCTYRYKIYIEGSAWSVSEKYILACDSMTLLVTPRYYDYFSRSLMPLQHYWPVKDDDECRSIKFAVDWGNKNQDEAQAIGEAASRLIRDDVKMDYVYDYMFHLLNEYAKLLKYEPSMVEGAVAMCSELMACNEGGLKKKFMDDSLVKRPSFLSPCTMSPPSFYSVVEAKNERLKQVETWENEYWKSSHNQV